MRGFELSDGRSNAGFGIAHKANIPPTLIVHSEDDKRFIAGSKLYHAALTEAKVPHEFLLYPTGGHGYALHCAGDAKNWPQEALKWLRKIGVQ